MTTEHSDGACTPSFSSDGLERSAFEKWYAGDMPKSLERADDGTYKYMNAQIAWGVWKAATSAERERITTKLSVASALEGFGCACEPTYQCGTCKARDILDKALGPLLRELRSNAVANSAGACASPGREATES